MLAVTAETGFVCPPQLEGLLERFQQALGDQLRAGGERDVLGDHDELVAAEAPERVGVAHDAFQAARRRPAAARRRRRGRACR